MISLTRSGLLCTPAVIDAFNRVDRGARAPAWHIHGRSISPVAPGSVNSRDAGHFIDSPEHSTEEVRYINAPFRNGQQHLSAPCIYATALEALELSVGCSFLNVCAGTGYFSAVASQILGNKACCAPA